RLRRMFDLDADPSVIDAQLSLGGLGALVRKRRGLRIPGAYDGFEAALSTLLLDARTGGSDPAGTANRFVAAYGEPFESGVPGLSHLPPTAARIAAAGAASLEAIGVSPSAAEAIAAIAGARARGLLPMRPRSDAAAARHALMDASGIEQRL